nr:unnamed protein product [Spirometra erinaceieuropaei]
MSVQIDMAIDASCARVSGFEELSGLLGVCHGNNFGSFPIEVMAAFKGLKAELLLLTSISDRQRYHALVKEEALGYHNPLELLRPMRSLVGDMAIDDKFFKELFSELLPRSVQTILASGSDDLDISRLAEITDRVIEVERLSSTTVAQASQPLTASTSDLSKLKTQIVQLSATVAAAAIRRSVSTFLWP